jgi:hypothetical protein
MKNMRILFAAVLLLAGISLFGQDQTVTQLKSTAEKNLADDTTHKLGWKTGGVVNLGLAQGSTSNWAAGGEEFSLTLTSFLNLYANHKTEKTKWVNNLDLFYAIQRTTSQGLRKNDDRIDLYSKYTRLLSEKWSFGIVGNFRTQFTDGYNYSETPIERISDLFAPAYLTIAPGLEWAPNDAFSIFMSPISARWVFVKSDEDSLGTRYGLDPGKTSKFEAGAFVSVNFRKEVAKNIGIKSRLDLYSNYLKNPQNVDIFWTNVIAMKINNWLAITYNLDLIYDDDVRLFGPTGDAPRTQLKSLLSVGFTSKF